MTFVPIDLVEALLGPDWRMLLDHAEPDVQYTEFEDGVPTISIQARWAGVSRQCIWVETAPFVELVKRTIRRGPW